jgi:uncharacterized Zn-finger protein
MIKQNSIKVSNTSVSCKGTDSPLDHPLVYLQIDPRIGEIDCPYCSCKFILDGK